MKIYRPLQTNVLNQGFGDNLPCVKLGVDGKPVRPFQVVTGADHSTCPIGYTKFYPAIGMTGHNGEDWNCYFREPVYFPVIEDGSEWVALNSVDADGGIGVDVYSRKPIAFDTLPVHTPGQFRQIEDMWAETGKLYPIFRFWHLHESTVTNGQVVKAGDLLGYADSTGASSGNHLHWAMKFSNGGFFSIDTDNGYTGAVDFRPYFENTFILDKVAPPKPLFTTPMERGQTNADIARMQSILITLGDMAPIKADEFGIYGGKTQTAVFKFQLREVPNLTWADKNVYKGRYAGKKTLPYLNKYV